MTKLIVYYHDDDGEFKYEKEIVYDPNSTLLMLKQLGESLLDTIDERGNIALDYDLVD